MEVISANNELHHLELSNGEKKPSRLISSRPHNKDAVFEDRNRYSNPQWSSIMFLRA